MHKTFKNKAHYFSLLIVVSVALLVSACSSGGDSGAASGSGSSSVEGNVRSSTFAMLTPTGNEEYSSQSKEYSLVALFKFLSPVQTVFASSTVSGIHVSVGQLGTTTNSSGYFRIDGVPPGTHQVMFSQNNQTASTTIRVGEDEMVSIQNIRMSGSDAHAGNITRTPMGSQGGIPQQPPHTR